MKKLFGKLFQGIMQSENGEEEDVDLRVQLPDKPPEGSYEPRFPILPNTPVGQGGGTCQRCGERSNCNGCIDPDLQSLVIDNGSGMMKVGFSGDDEPRAVFPTIYGRYKNPGINIGMKSRDCTVGDEAQAKRGILNLFHPIQNGQVKLWNDMEKIWHHSFYNEIRVTPEEHPTCLTEQPYTPSKNREKTTQIMFETFNVPALYIALAPVLSLYASGRVTGIVVQAGQSVTHTVPIFEASPIQHATLRSDVSGNDVTEYLIKLLSTEQNLEMTTSSEREIVRDMKEKMCYVSLDYERELRKKGENTSYELPDGSKIDLFQERFMAPEILFKPNLIDKERSKDFFVHLPRIGIHDMIYHSIRRCDFDLRNSLWQNIVLSGGSTLFEGLVERLSEESRKLKPTRNTGPKVNAPFYRKYSAWIGGSILTSLSTFQNQWVTTDEYDEYGPRIIQVKCFEGNYPDRYLFGPLMGRNMNDEESLKDLRERKEFLVEKFFLIEEGEEEGGVEIKIEGMDKIFLPVVFKQII